MVGEIDGDTGRNTMNTQGKIEPIVEPNFYKTSCSSLTHNCLLKRERRTW